MGRGRMRRRLFAACMGAESRGLCSCGKPGHKQGKGARTGQRPTSRAGKPPAGGSAATRGGVVVENNLFSVVVAVASGLQTIFSRRGGGCGVPVRRTVSVCRCNDG
jgi:hypothetical protein